MSEIVRGMTPSRRQLELLAEAVRNILDHPDNNPDNPEMDLSGTLVVGGYDGLNAIIEALPGEVYRELHRRIIWPLYLDPILLGVVWAKAEHLGRRLSLEVRIAKLAYSILDTVTRLRQKPDDQNLIEMLYLDYGQLKGIIVAGSNEDGGSAGYAIMRAPEIHQTVVLAMREASVFLDGYEWWMSDDSLEIADLPLDDVLERLRVAVDVATRRTQALSKLR